MLEIGSKVQFNVGRRVVTATVVEKLRDGSVGPRGARRPPKYLLRCHTGSLVVRTEDSLRLLACPA